MKRRFCLFMACAMLFSCAKEMEVPVQPQQPAGEEVKTYTLTVDAGKGERPGTGSDDYGQLSIGDNVMVSSWNGNEGPYPAELRRDYCWYRTQARIEPCTHPGYTAETCPYHKHD